MESMKQHRRGFLQLFGLSTAAVATTTEPTVQIIESPNNLPSPLPPGPLPQLENLLRYEVHDVRDEPLWSQLRIEPNSMQERYSLFQDLGPSRSLTETNMEQPGHLLAPEMYCIKQIGFVFSPQTIPGLRSAFIDRYSLQLSIKRKRYWEAPLASVFSVGEPDRDEKGFATLPDTGFANLEIPLIIEANVYFCLSVIGKPIHPCGKITGWGVFKGLHLAGVS
jgi:hypothetical protein